MISPLQHLIKKCNVCGTEADPTDTVPCQSCSGEDWSFKCGRHGCIAKTDGCELCGYRFLGILFHDQTQLARAMSANWTEGIAATKRRSLLRWAEEGLDDKGLARRFRKIADDFKLSSEQKFCVSQLALDPASPLCWRSYAITRKWLRENPSLAIELMGSSVPDWVKRLGGAIWLSSCQTCWKDLCRLAKAAGATFDLTSAAVSLVFAQMDELVTIVTQIRENCDGSEKKSIDRILRKKDVDQAEAIFLIVCYQAKLLKTKTEVWQAELQERSNELRLLAREIERGGADRLSLEKFERQLGKLADEVEARRLVLSTPNQQQYLSEEVIRLLKICEVK